LQEKPFSMFLLMVVLHPMYCVVLRAHHGGKHMLIVDFFHKKNTIAGPGFNHWLIPPAALAIHLCIGMTYGFSVFWLPLSHALGVSRSVGTAIACDPHIGLLAWIFSSDCDWGIPLLGWMYTLFFVLLGSSAAIWGGWLEHAGPRKAGAVSASCWCGGAMIGSPLAVMLMDHFATPTSVGVAETFVVMAAVYFVFMMAGALTYRVPPTGWSPPPPDAKAMITQRHVHASRVWGIPQFWLLWLVLMLNVSAGIGVIGMASPLLQEIFAGRLIGVDAAFNDLDAGQAARIAAIAAGFTGLLSLFNLGGRFVWASVSDYIGRKNTYFVFFVLGAMLYAAIPALGKTGNLALFVAACCLILSMYGGGFATIPAYLSDLFGTQMVGAIHGRLLTAWSFAGILGPILVNYLRDYQLGQGVARADAYNATMYILAVMLLLGLICNALVRPLADKYFMSDAELARERQLAHERAAIGPAADAGSASATAPGSRVSGPVLLVLAWLAVGLPLAWGVWSTVEKAVVFFR
jgi:MFS family permease